MGCYEEPPLTSTYFWVDRLVFEPAVPEKNAETDKDAEEVKDEGGRKAIYVTVRGLFDDHKPKEEIKVLFSFSSFSSFFFSCHACCLWPPACQCPCPCVFLSH
eukprot:3394555-Rhodomonas_salina.1